DSQTVPAKFSERNAALDRLPTMAAPLKLSDEQRRKILATIRAGNAPVANVNTSVAEQLPSDVEIRDIPDAIARDFPEVNTLKYARGGARPLWAAPHTPTAAAKHRGGGRARAARPPRHPTAACAPSPAPPGSAAAGRAPPPPHSASSGESPPRSSCQACRS